MSKSRDWKGNKKTTYVTLGASSHSTGDREIHDYYATDPIAIEYLLGVEEFTKTIWEPACGEGHLSKALQKRGYKVRSTDLVDRGYGNKHGTLDFLSNQDSLLSKVNIRDIITNPPYKYAEDFIKQSHDISQKGTKIAMFLKLLFLESSKRKKLFQKYPPKTVYIFTKRIKCAINGDFSNKKGKAVAYAWYIWEVGYSGDTIIKWL